MGVNTTAGNHLLGGERLQEIEGQVRQWPHLQELAATSPFFEAFSLLDEQGEPTGSTTWRGLCHWLGLRHGSVQGLLFTPKRLVVLQRRGAGVADSPGFLEMSFAGHLGRAGVMEAMTAEARGECGLTLTAGSPQVPIPTDLAPIVRYAYSEPPRHEEVFYNVEVRYVFAIRINGEAMAALQPLDGEVASFLLAPLAEARRLLAGERVASALRVSGPKALDHAVREWGWGDR